MIDSKLRVTIDNWRLPDGGSLLERIERMIHPTLMHGHFGSSPTLIVCGLQYHLGGERDIGIGWKALDHRLSEQEEAFATELGKDWVREAHNEFADEIQQMREGKWGNGRMVATKRKTGGSA